MPLASVNGVKIYYETHGEGEALMLISGTGASCDGWRKYQVPAFAKHHKVVIFDHRGVGKSDKPDETYSTRGFAADAVGLMEFLGIVRCSFIGHSMGGRNAYVFASRHQTGIRGLVIVDTGPKTDQRGSNRIRQFRELPDQLSTYHEFAERIHGYTGRPIQHILGALKYTIRQTASGNWTWKYDSALRDPNYQPSTWPESKLWDAISKISVPTLIVRGEKSDIFGVETLDQILESITGSTSATIPNAGHLVPGDNPAAFIEAITDFLDNI